MNDHQSESYDENEESPVKIWLEENLRVLLSIIIVIAIAGGIYSYSKRSQAPTVDDTSEQTQDSLLDKIVSEEKENEDARIDQKKDSAVSKQDSSSQVTSTATDTSKETNTAFIESAQQGDGSTHLARRALAHYLEKNPDSALTVEHKIYIEDYLRKNVRAGDSIAVGSSVEFSKSLIQGAVEKSKQLNERQLQNLKKYSARVPSLR